MRCKHCEYRLWNLRSRTCPECGTPFAPSQFEFAPSSVRFCCPHCNQEYYGTAANGHLVPFAFECVSCQQRVTMDEMVLLPAEGLEEDQTVAEVLPWLDRNRRGFIRSWFSTVGMALVRPGRLIELAPIEGAVGSAWWFALLTCVVVAVVAIVPFLAMGLIFGGGGPPMALFGPMAGFSLFALVAVLAGITIWGVLAHAILRLTGNVHSSIGRTYQALCFSAGAYAVSAVPCLGLYIGWIWWIVSAAIMVMRGQRVGGFRATVAVIVMPLLLCGGGAWWLYSSIAGGMAAMAGAGVDAETRLVTDGILLYAEAHDYRGPGHALVLVSDGYLNDEYDLVTSQSPTDLSDIPVGAGTLEDFVDKSTEERTQLASAAAHALPADVIAHRVGDFVFTYHGAVLNECPISLWIVIQSDDPSTPGYAGQSGGDVTANPYFATNAGGGVYVGMADGTTNLVPTKQFPAALATQNQLRATINLPPLPDPVTVTHDKPAVATTPAANPSDKSTTG